MKNIGIILFMLLLLYAYPVAAQTMSGSKPTAPASSFPEVITLTQDFLTAQKAPDSSATRARKAAGEEVIFAWHTLQTSGAVVLEKGLAYEFRAGESIELGPGFTADPATTFTALISSTAPESAPHTTWIAAGTTPEKETSQADTAALAAAASETEEEEGKAISRKARLWQNAPNPFSESTTIAYQIPGEFRQAFITVYSITGEEVSRFDLSGQARGEVQVKAGSLGSGIYVYQLWVDGQRADSKKMMLVR